MNIIRFQDTKVTKWSGGETHEFLILPLNANFKSGEYDLRISLATVTLETTIFTSLPEAHRILTVLEGNLKLVHENQHTVYLRPLEQDRFEGEWITKSYGKVKDFNVIWKSGDATVDIKTLEKGTMFKGNTYLSLLFVVDGTLNCEGVEAYSSDSIQLTELDEIVVKSDCKIIHVQYSK